jgi:hexosaminidase
MRLFHSLFYILILAGAFLCTIPGNAELNLVPYPRYVHQQSGTLSFSAPFNIFAYDSSLAPLRFVLEEELYRITGIPQGLSKHPHAGPFIFLRLSSSLTGEAYRVTINDTITVEGGNYTAVAMGTVTLLQLLKTVNSGKYSLPRLTITDAPFTGYRGLMVDVGLRWHPSENLKPVIDLCRMYKINYLGLHHNNDQVDAMLTGKADSMTLAEKKRRNNSYYTRNEMEEMIAYAKARGVTMVPFASPFIDTKSYPDIFTGFNQGNRVIQDCPEYWQAMDKKITLLCELYKDSPYIHLGAMAGEAAHFGANATQRAFMKKHGIRNSNEYYIWLTEQMRALVNKHGKTCMIWEGVRPCDSKIPLSKDVIICAYSMHYYLPTEALRDGYPVINCSWLPLYSVQAQNNFSPRAETVYAWNMGRFQHRQPGAAPYQIPPDAPILKGAQLTIWEETYESVMPDLRLRAPAFSERTWNPDAGRTFEDLVKRRKATDALLQRIVYPVQIQVQHEYVAGDPVFSHEQAIGCRSTLPGTIRYDLADNWNSFPSASSPRYIAPIVITSSTAVSFQLFDKNNKPVGAPAQRYFSKFDPLLYYTAYGHPPYGGWLEMPDVSELSILKKGVFGRMSVDRYAQIARCTFTPPAKYAHIDVRPHGLYNNYLLEMQGQISVPTSGVYTILIRTRDGLGELYIDGKPIAVRTAFAGPATAFRGELPAGTFPVMIKYFARQIYSDLNLKYTGPGMKKPKPLEDLLLSTSQWKPDEKLDILPADTVFVDLEKEQNKHLALDKPVTASGRPQGGNLSRNAVDGKITNQSGWHVAPYPQWLQIDLEKPELIDRIRVVTFHDRRRFYQYRIAVSSEGKKWQQVVDMSSNTVVSTAQGHIHAFPPQNARFVKITMLKNSANPGVHLNELMVFPAEKAQQKLYGTLIHTATRRRANGVALSLEKDGKEIAKTTTGTDGSFLLSTDEQGPFILTSPENNGTVDGELIGIHEAIPAFTGNKKINVISDTTRLHRQ